MAGDSDPEWLKSFSPAESRAASPAVSSSSGDSDVPTYQHRAFEDDDDVPFRDLQVSARGIVRGQGKGGVECLPSVALLIEKGPCCAGAGEDGGAGHRQQSERALGLGQ
jgi:hypothetical protein|eukprot:SAG25_NODE_807_length_5249_cov_3.894369_4_plen_109_part_00